jgi:hypothetical protein
MPTTPDLLTPQEFADALRLDVETIRRRIRRNNVDHYFEDDSLVNVGTGKKNQWRIRRSELDRVLDAA